MTKNVNNKIILENVLCDCENLFNQLNNNDIKEVDTFVEYCLKYNGQKIRLSIDGESQYYDILKNNRLVVCDGETHEFYYDNVSKVFMLSYNDLILKFTVEEMKLLNENAVESLKDIM